MVRTLLLCLCFLCTHAALSQSKTLDAVKTIQPPVIDGKPDDAAWQQALPVTDFVQNYPSFGQAASAKTEVRFLYDDNAVYVSAFLHDDPSLIRKQLTARDDERRQDVDYFAVAFDTYNDRQNGFLFLVTPANVQTDAKITAGQHFGYGVIDGTRTWDAVWQSKVTYSNEGWHVEMRIPYISLRFAKKDVQTWGIQFVRFSRRTNEASTWNPVNPQENGFINQFGKCMGLRDIKPPLRLSFSPYVTTGYRRYPLNDSTFRREFLRNGGMDVKYGINESFTLDATLIPDFGQVISDNLVNNLTPFEQFFRENRPFFTEGTELFDKGEDILFYSRRVGAIPAKYRQVEALGDQPTDKYTVQKNPSITQLYNAIKLSGRTKDKLGIGVFNAVTAQMEARLTNKSHGGDSVIITEPLANYNVVVLDQALRNRSSLTFINTNVIRSGEDADANVSGLDLNLFTRNNQYLFKAAARYSTVLGFTPYQSRINNVNFHEDTVRRNGRVMIPSYSGHNLLFGAAKVSGKLQFDWKTNIESKTYDPNDLGYLENPNEVQHEATLGYYQQTATDKFVSYGYEVYVRHRSLFQPHTFTDFEFNAGGEWVLKNFWDFKIGGGAQPVRAVDYFELREWGKYLNRPAFWYTRAGGSTDSRKRLWISSNLSYAHTDIEDGNYFQTQSIARYRFSNRFRLQLSLNTENEETQLGYAFEPKVNNLPVVGYRRYLQTESILSGIYNFTPRMNLSLRARHYWNEVTYKKFFNVRSDGGLTPIPYIVDNNSSTVNLFNLDAFFTWDFRLGSRLIVGYKNWSVADEAVVGLRNYFGNLNGIFTGYHGNELTVRFVYFLDYNQRRGKP